MPEKYGYLGIRGRELFGILSQASIPAVLNPNWSWGRTFLPEEIARLAEGPEPRLVVTIASTGDTGAVVKDAGVIAREIMKDGPAVDFTVIQQGADAPLSGGSDPFYTG